MDELFEGIEKLIEAKLSNKESFSKENQSDFITRIDVSKLLKVSLPTLNDWTKLGWLKSYKMGNRVYYKAKEVEDALTRLSTRKGK